MPSLSTRAEQDPFITAGRAISSLISLSISGVNIYRRPGVQDTTHHAHHRLRPRGQRLRFPPSLFTTSEASLCGFHASPATNILRERFWQISAVFASHWPALWGCRLECHGRCQSSGNTFFNIQQRGPSPLNTNECASKILQGTKRRAEAMWMA
jgi:hypothetical protein